MSKRLAVATSVLGDILERFNTSAMRMSGSHSNMTAVPFFQYLSENVGLRRFMRRLEAGD